jgi:hypothetical protein
MINDFQPSPDYSRRCIQELEKQVAELRDQIEILKEKVKEMSSRLSGDK